MQNERSTNEYTDKCVREDLRGTTKARLLWPVIHSFHGMLYQLISTKFGGITRMELIAHNPHKSLYNPFARLLGAPPNPRSEDCWSCGFALR